MTDSTSTQLPHSGRPMFPLLPHHRAQPPPYPRVEGFEDLTGLAVPEVPSPSPQVYRQLGGSPLEAHASRPARQLPHSLLETLHGLRRDPPQRPCPARKAKAQKLPLPRPRHRTLLSVHLQLELLRDEVTHALHHPLSPPLASDVDVAVVGVAYESVSASLQLPVQIVQHEVRQQGRQRSALRRPFIRWTHQPVLHHSGVDERPDELEQSLVRYPLRHPPHQHVVVDPVEEFLQVDVYHPAVALGLILLRLGHRLMSRAVRPEAVALLRKRPVPSALQHLQHRLLHESIEHRRDSELPRSSVGLVDLDSSHRLRLIRAAHQLFADLRPVVLEIARQLFHPHPVHSRATPIRPHAPERFLQVLPLTHLLHQSLGSARAFVSALRHERFGPFRRRLGGFTLLTRRQGQLELAFLPSRAHESAGLPALPSVRAFDAPFPVLRPLAVSPLSGECPDRADRLHAPTTPSADSCAAIRSLSTPPVSSETRHRPPAVSSTAFHAQPPNLRDVPLMDM